MKKITLRITAPHFVAGIVAVDGRVSEAAPILGYMRGWDGRLVAEHCKKKSWQWERIDMVVEPTRVLICGGRHYNDAPAVFRTLDELLKEKERLFVITGGARGADTIAVDWRQTVGAPGRIYRADWNKYGKAAGPIRNQQMLDEGKPELVIAFPGGTGTQDMIDRAERAGVEVRKIV